MGLDSYLELFTTMFGWSFAANIVSVLSETGLTALPLFFLFVGTWLQAHEQGLENGGVTWMIRQLEVKLFTAIFVYITCVQGWTITSLANMELTYTPMPTAVEPAPVRVAGNATDTAYDSAFNGVPGIANVPPWWYTVMAVSSGVNAAVKASTATTIRDLRTIQYIASTATITDTLLRSEMQRFNAECFVPARSRYLTPEFVATGAAAAIAAHGDADVSWPGSHAFQEDVGLYPTLYAATPVPGFVFSYSAEPDIDTGEPAPEWARPPCDQWWADNNIGLRKKLADHVSAWQRYGTIISVAFGSLTADERLDHLAQLAFSKTRLSYIDTTRVVGDDRTNWAKVDHAPLDILGAIGAGKKAFEVGASMMPLITLITMFQPIVLMAIYMFLPIVTVFSGYDLKIMVLGALGIFTVKFWSVMWWLARWLDDHLIEAMYPGSTTALELLRGGLDDNYKRMILNILLGFMYLALPMIWTAVMAWGGHRISSGLDMLAREVGGVAKDAGARGVAIGKDIARGIGKASASGGAGK